MKLLLALMLAVPCFGQILTPILFGTSAAAPMTFTGMGNINTTGVVVAYGLRAYSAATRGNKLVNVCDALDAHCIDMLSDATTGNAIIPTSNPDCTSFACTIKTWYDLSGNTFCSSAACNLTAVAASRAILTLNCIGTRPCAQVSGGTINPATGAMLSGATAQPYTLSAVVARTGAFTTQQGVIYLNGNGGDIEFNSTTNTALMYAGSVATATASNTTTHAMQAMFNGASSNFYIDGTANTVNPGTSGFGGSGNIFLMSSGATALTGNFFEAAAWSGDQSANNAAMNLNQHNYWGF